MAADNREFVNKFANEGGGDVLVEDKRLEELKSATAKTSSQISTTEQYIPLQDTDGNIVKINPASFEEAVRNVLGGLLANNDKGTTISGIPALSGSGQSLDFGSVTPANLASVLGVLKKIDRVSYTIDGTYYEGIKCKVTDMICFEIVGSCTSLNSPSLRIRGAYEQNIAEKTWRTI